MAETVDTPQRKTLFTEQDAIGQAVLAWWKTLHGLQGNSLEALQEAPMAPGMAGQRAELKRAETEAEVVFCVAYQRLRLALKQAAAQLNEPFALPEDAMVAVARVLGRVKNRVEGREASLTFPVRMGAPLKDGDDKPRVSELRFKPLLRIDNRLELANALVRLLPMLENRAQPLALARDIWFWNENTRKRWANDYYQALLTNPLNS